MPRIRNNESFPAAAVSDTASVAATQQRGPLHPQSQGPLAPTAAVFDTAAVAASRRAQVTVSDTVTSSVAMGVVDTSIAASQAQAQAQAVAVTDTAAVVIPSPCLKKTLKYSSRQQMEAQWQSLPADAFHINEEHEENVHSCLDQIQEGAKVERQDKTIKDKDKKIVKWFETIMKIWKRHVYRPRMEDALLAYMVGKVAEYDKIYGSIVVDRRKSKRKDLQRAQIASFHDHFQAITTETRTTKVSFATVTATHYVLTEQERVFKLDEEIQRGKSQDRFPHRDFKQHAAKLYLRRGKQSLQAVFQRKGETAGQQILREQQQAAAEKDWKEIGHKQALQLDQQPLPRTHIAFVFSAFAQADVVDTSLSGIVPPPTVPQSQSSVPVVTDTTATASAVQQPQQVTTQSTMASSVASVSETVAQATVVSDTTAVQPTTMASAASVSDTVAPQTTVVSDTTAVQQQQSTTTMASAASVSDTVAPQSAGVSDSTAVQSTTMASASVPDTVAPQTTVVSDTTAASASVSDTVAPQTTVVPDTTAASASVPDTVATTVQSTVRRRTGVRQAAVVSDTTAVVEPLRRSARIAARNSGRDASPTLRRTTRKGAVKPKGFYKV